MTPVQHFSLFWLWHLICIYLYLFEHTSIANVPRQKATYLFIVSGQSNRDGLLSTGEAMKIGDVLTLPCDVLIPAAIGGVITENNADSLQCKFLVEAANGPTTPEGDLKLRERGITVLPDIYTNGGKTCMWNDV